MAEEILFDAGRALRHYLPQLVGAEKARDLDERLLALLRQRGRPGLEDDLAALFVSSSEAVHRWVAAFVEDQVPMDVRSDRQRSADTTFRSINGGHTVSPVPALRYVCPEDGLIARYLMEPPRSVLVCPEHGVPLVPG